MAKNFKIVEFADKGKGLIALKNFKKGEKLFDVDKSQSVIFQKDIQNLSKKDQEHLPTSARLNL